jgi:hypothetical protein
MSRLMPSIRLCGLKSRVIVVEVIGVLRVLDTPPPKSEARVANPKPK